MTDSYTFTRNAVDKLRRDHDHLRSQVRNVQRSYERISRHRVVNVSNPTQYAFEIKRTESSDTWTDSVPYTDWDITSSTLTVTNPAIVKNSGNDGVVLPVGGLWWIAVSCRVRLSWSSTDYSTLIVDLTVRDPQASYAVYSSNGAPEAMNTFGDVSGLRTGDEHLLANSAIASFDANDEVGLRVAGATIVSLNNVTMHDAVFQMSGCYIGAAV